MFKTLRNLTTFVTLAIFSSHSFGSLIVNGSFEQLSFDDNSTSMGEIFNTNLQAFENKNSAWDVFHNIPGWSTTLGNGIELQKNVVTKSQDGNHHVELDSHQRGASNAMMTQTIDSLIVGEDYLLEFFYKPRTNTANDNGINVFWHDAAIDFDNTIQASYSADSTRKLTPGWQVQSISLTATATSMDVSFASFGRQNTLGGLVDNVSLVGPTSVIGVTDVPEPSMLALLLLPLGLLVRKQRKVRIK